MPAGTQPPQIRPSSPPLLEARGIVKHYPCGTAAHRGRSVQAVDGVSFTVDRGMTLGLVGESGCGKTTTARIIVRLLEPSAGDVLFEGESLMGATAGRLRELRKRLQLVFQDSSDALNPRLTVESSVGEGLLVSGVRGASERRARVADMLRRVGLDPHHHLSRHPHELSGGQRQRVGIARALVVRPSLVVCDEAVSSLDVSVQAQIVNLLRRLQEEDGHGYVLISHDLSVVRHLSDRVAVMYLGRIVEIGPVESLYGSPHHPYTRALLEAVPVLNPSDRPARSVLPGEPPSPVDPPRGCRFHPRCPRAFERCRIEDPSPVDVESDHQSWCFLPVGEGSRT